MDKRMAQISLRLNTIVFGDIYDSYKTWSKNQEDIKKTRDPDIGKSERPQAEEDEIDFDFLLELVPPVDCI